MERKRLSVTNINATSTPKNIQSSHQRLQCLSLSIQRIATENAERNLEKDAAWLLHSNEYTTRLSGDLVSAKIPIPFVLSY